MTIPHISIPYDSLDAFCRRHQIYKVALFGSVLRDDFRADSDIDILIDVEAPSLAKLLQIEEAFSRLFGRAVDVGEWQAVEEDSYFLRRNEILSGLQVIYER
jgi:uncharacterized protein